MRIGIKFPTREIGSDPRIIRDWALAANDLAFSHICLIDHVLGADPDVRPDWAANWPLDPMVSPPYDMSDEFHEPLVIMGFLAALTSIELSTGVLVSPQRQTALLAKQAAEVALLTAGRLRLVLAVGWNHVEFEALGERFGRRGRRLDEQITLLRALWSQRTVQFRGEFDQVVGAGIAPRPVDGQVPIWIGGYSDAALRRAAEVGDGWLGGESPTGSARRMAAVRGLADAHGRDGSSLGMEGNVSLRDGDWKRLSPAVDHWQRCGATHLTIDTMGCGLRGAQHTAAITRVARELRL
jgi:probable F420-dependent oxidoreductase